MRVERVVTAGTFNLDGGSWDVENNVWLVGDDDEVLVIDAAHDAEAIELAVGIRHVVAVACTHAHDDHVSAARELAIAAGAPVLLHPADEPLWRMTYPDWRWSRDLADGDVIPVAGQELHVLHTPGHAPGAVCLYAPGLGAVFTGDTLFEGGPGATGRSFSDRGVLLASIRDRLLTLDDATAVHTGHGDDTTIGAERGGVEAALPELRA